MKQYFLSLAFIVPLALSANQTGILTQFNNDAISKEGVNNRALSKAGLVHTAFGDEGVKNFAIPSGATFMYPTSIASDGKFFYTGGAQGGSNTFFINKLDRNGNSVKAITGTAGDALSLISMVYNPTTKSLHLLLTDSSGTTTYIYTYDENLNRNTSFGTDGVVTVGSGMNDGSSIIYDNGFLYTLTTDGSDAKIHKFDATTGAAASGFSTVTISGYGNDSNGMFLHEGKLYVTVNDVTDTVIKKYDATTGAADSTFGTVTLAGALASELSIEVIAIINTTLYVATYSEDTGNTTLHTFAISDGTSGSTATLASFIPVRIKAEPDNTLFCMGYNGSAKGTLINLAADLTLNANFGSNGTTTVNSPLILFVDKAPLPDDGHLCLGIEIAREPFYEEILMQLSGKTNTLNDSLQSLAVVNQTPLTALGV